jgi:hypothetical protein
MLIVVEYHFCNPKKETLLKKNSQKSDLEESIFQWFLREKQLLWRRKKRKTREEEIVWKDHSMIQEGNSSELKETCRKGSSSITTTVSSNNSHSKLKVFAK